MKKVRPKSHRVIAIAASVLCALAVWELAAGLMGLALIFPGPIQTIQVFVQLLTEGAFWISVLQSLWRVVLSFGIGLAICLPLGILMGRRAFFWDFFQVWQAAFRSAPVISVILIALLWFRDAGQVAVFVSFLMVFPILLSAIAQGSRSEDPALVEMAQVYGLGFSRRLVWITLPWLRPFLLSSGKAALGIAWKVVAAAEVLAQPKYGLGSMMQDGRINLQTDRVFALTLAVILLSVLGDLFWNGLFRLLEGWDSQKGKSTQAVPAETALSASPAETETPVSGLRAIPLAAATSPAVPEIPASKHILTAEHLVFSWDQAASPVIPDWSGRIVQGGVHMLMAPSGKGKTTLGRLLMGLELPQGGSLSRAPGMACFPVFQEHRLLPWARVRRNVLLARNRSLPAGPSQSGTGSENRTMTLDDLAELLEIPHTLDSFPHELSGGMRQRVSLLRSLYAGQFLGSQAFYLWDEPFQSLDEALKARILPRLGAFIHAQGASALIITHSPQDALILGIPTCNLQI